MIDFLFYLVINSLWIWGVSCLFSENHIFEKQGDWMVENLPEWITKPLFDCPACMSSFHGLLFFFIGMPLCFHDALPIIMLIVYIISLCGWNYLLIKLTNRKREIKLTDDKDF